MTFSDPQITKQDKDWLYPQMIELLNLLKKNFYVLNKNKKGKC
jgi:hypothetical protein